MTIWRKKMEAFLVWNWAEYFLCLFSVHGQLVIPQELYRQDAKMVLAIEPTRLFKI